MAADTEAEAKVDEWETSVLRAENLTHTLAAAEMKRVQKNVEKAFESAKLLFASGYEAAVAEMHLWPVGDAVEAAREAFAHKVHTCTGPLVATTFTQRLSDAIDGLSETDKVRFRAEAHAQMAKNKVFAISWAVRRFDDVIEQKRMHGVHARAYSLTHPAVVQQAEGFVPWEVRLCTYAKRLRWHINAPQRWVTRVVAQVLGWVGGLVVNAIEEKREALIQEAENRFRTDASTTGLSEAYALTAIECVAVARMALRGEAEQPEYQSARKATPWSTAEPAKTWVELRTPMEGNLDGDIFRRRS